MNVHLLLCVAFSSVVLTGPLRPDRSKYFQYASAGFLMSEGTVIYSVDYEIIHDLPPGHHLAISFENPKRGAPEITDVAFLQLSEKDLFVQSPNLECISNNRKYEVRIDVFASKAKRTKLVTHVIHAEFRVPEGSIDELGIKRC